LSVTEISSVNELNAVLEDNEVVVVDFAAPDRCRPCQKFAPHYEATAEKMGDVKFLAVDIDKADPELVDSYKIQSVPTVLAFKDGELVGPVEARTGIKLVSELSSI
jgi:thioredoxin-like negative regulator of GroEL